MLIWGYSSAGRALEWHSRGQRFDPAYLHQHKVVRTSGQSAREFGLLIFSMILYCSSQGCRILRYPCFGCLSAVLLAVRHFQAYPETPGAFLPDPGGGHKTSAARERLLPGGISMIYSGRTTRKPDAFISIICFSRIFPYLSTAIRAFFSENAIPIFITDGSLIACKSVSYLRLLI